MSYAGMGANIAGTELQGWAALLEKWAMQKAFQDEANKQAGYRTQALGTFGQGLPMAGSAMAQPTMDAAAAQRRAGYQTIGAVPLSVSPSTTPSQSRNPGADAAYAALIGGNRARLGAYGDWRLAQDLSAMQTGRNLNQISSFAGGQARVFPYQMYKAQHSQDAMAAIGQALSSLGGGGGGGIGQQYIQQPQAQYGSGLDQWGMGNYLNARMSGPGVIDPNIGAGILAGY